MYERCCGLLHEGKGPAPTAEALMRSRYSAYVRGDEAYLLATWHPSTRPARLDLDPAMRWTGLEIVSTAHGQLLDQTGTVEFRAHYERDGEPGVLVEHSRFTRVDARWVYVEALA